MCWRRGKYYLINNCFKLNKAVNCSGLSMCWNNFHLITTHIFFRRLFAVCLFFLNSWLEQAISGSVSIFCAITCWTWAAALRKNCLHWKCRARWKSWCSPICSQSGCNSTVLRISTIRDGRSLRRIHNSKKHIMRLNLLILLQYVPPSLHNCNVRIDVLR